MKETGDTGGRETRLLLLQLLFLGCLLAVVHGHFGSCEDHTPRCPFLARRGDCHKRRQFMLQNCPVSCDACVDPNCYDRSNRCTENAQRGLCESQQSFMVRHCPHSCDACNIGPSNAVALTNIKTIIRPEFACGSPLNAAGSARHKRQVFFPHEFDEINKRPRVRVQPPQQPTVNQAAPKVTDRLVPVILMPNRSLAVEDTFCGATPITDRFLLTAAHCVFDSERPVLTVRLGELDFSRQDEANSMPVDYTVAQIFVHPDYDPSTLVRYNDIAIIQTVEKMQFNDLVYPYCISENAPAPGTIVTGAGFGLVNATFRPTQLQEADLEVLEASVCEERYRQEQFLPQLRLRYPELLQGKSILCASYPERSACQGDSGGPLYEERSGRRHLVGIISSGVSCRGNGVSSLPGLYINVADHIEFIDSVVHSPALL